MLGYVEEWDCSQILQVLFFVVPKRLTKLLLTCYLLKKNITVNQILDLLDCRISLSLILCCKIRHNIPLHLVIHNL